MTIDKVSVTQQCLTILGCTGSIGVSTLDVVARHPERYRVYALTANTRVDLIIPQIQSHQPRFAVLRDEQAAQQLSDQLSQLGITGTEVLSGEAGLLQVAAADEVDSVMAAIVGAAGLLPTMAAVDAGKKVLLANKESLVMAGHLFMQAVAKSGATLLPIDSEHNAIFQCMPARYQRGEQVGLAEQGVSNGGAHVRISQLSQHRAIAVFNHGVNNTLGMDDDIDFVRAGIK